MPSRASFQIIGHVGKTPEADLQSTQAGVTYVRISVATTKYKNRVEQTTWFTVTLFGDTAIQAASKIVKGDLVLLDGEMSESSYTDKNGLTQRGYSFIAYKFMILKSSGHASVKVNLPVPVSEDFDDAVPF